MGDAEVKAFLDHIVLKRNMSPRTQSAALNALAFLYKHIVKNELSLNLNFARSNRQPKLPVLMTPDEVKQLMSHLSKRYYLITGLMYGSGLRVMEAVQLRVKDIDFDYKGYYASYLAPFICNAPIAKWRRYSHRSSTIGPF